ncbi:hypothetical protein [Acetobacter sp.]|uniref:hypothetical protein n=1 Tax=Acetobacter sp. TaxID=440 RepID=UPI0039E84B33
MAVSMYQGYVLAQQFLASQGGIDGNTETSTNSTAAASSSQASVTATESSTTDTYDANGPAVLVTMGGGTMRFAADSLYDGKPMADLSGAVMVDGDQEVTLASASSSSSALLYTKSGVTAENREDTLIASLFQSNSGDQF